MSPSSQRPGVWPFVAIGAAVVLFGNTFPAAKVCVAALGGAGVPHPPLAFVPMRFAPAALVFLALSLTVFRREVAAVFRESGLRVALAGLFVVPGYNILFNSGLEEINPGVSSLIIATAPIQTLLLSIPLLGERIRGAQLGGIVVAFAGIFIVVRLGQGQEISGTLTPDLIRGSLITLFAPTMWAMYTILLKPVLTRHPPLPVTAAAVMCGVLPMLPFVHVLSVQTLLAEPRTWGAWAFLSFGASVLAFWLWNVPLQTLSPTALALFVHFIPLVAITASILFWRTETFNMWLLIGGAVVILGVALANGELLRRRPAHAAVPLPLAVEEEAGSSP
jgi:drug/metabolite transporter (DMT)-like permease